MPMKPLIYPFFAALFLAGCSNKASHLPNPILLPVYGVQSIFSEQAYNSRRTKVSRYVDKNFNALSQPDVHQDVYQQLYDIAHVAAEKQTPLLNELKERYKFYFLEDKSQNILVERVTVTVMVHSN